MSRRDAVTVVQAFHDYLNDRNVQSLLDLVTDDVRVGGPRGSGAGKHLLEEWVTRSNITMTPGRWFSSDGTLVVEQHAIWRDPDTGSETGSQTMATMFTMEGGRIAGVARYGFLAEAVHGAGMDESNEIEAPIQ